jgi:AcrR family transcriptional regulator
MCINRQICGFTCFWYTAGMSKKKSPTDSETLDGTEIDTVKRRPLPAVGRVAGGDARTRAHLIDVAIRLFARNGIEAVSMRQITAEAGQANQSAIQYYFGGKDGLIVAALDLFMEEVERVHESMESEFAAMGEKPNLKSVLHAYLDPLMTLHVSSPAARRAVQFADRLTRSDPEYYDLLVSKLLPYHQSFLARVQAALPDQPAEVTAIKVFYAVGTILHSLADTRLSMKGGVGPMKNFDQATLSAIFIDFIAGSIGGYSSSEKFDHGVGQQN